MSEGTKIRTKAPEAKKENAVSQACKPERSQSMNSPIDRIPHLQRTIGNQAVQRMLKSSVIQAKLKIGQPGDKYEQEANRVADLVMNMPEPNVKRQPEVEEEELQTKPLTDQITPLVQRQEEVEEKEEEPILPKLFSVEHPTLQRQAEPEKEEKSIQPKPIAEMITPLVQRQEEEEKEEEEEPIQTKPITEQITSMVQRQAEEEEEPIQARGNSSSSSAEATSGIESSINSLRAGGQPLPESVKSYFEPRLGADFSHVRIHADSKGAKTAKFIKAKAFAAGKNVVFGAGQYSPETSTGKRLLVHEMIHVIQQESTFYCKPAKRQTINLPRQKLEQEVPARSSGMDIGVQRQAGEGGGAYGGIVAENTEDIKFWENIAKKDTYMVPIPIPTEWKAGVGMGKEREITVELRSGERFGQYVFIMRNFTDKYQIYFKYKSNVIRKTDLSCWEKALLNEAKDNLELRQKLRSYAIREKEKEEPPIMRISTQIYFDYNKWEPKWPATVDYAAVEIQQYLYFPTSFFPESIVPPIGKRYVRILGFASREGPLASNQRLSQRRADRVKKLLEDRGIPSNKLIAKGMGVSVLARKRKPGGYWRDRRVIFVLKPPIGIVPEY